ncbi:MAG: HAMP domain-containing histidine kinase [Bacilli bacterium]|nr:HAMP domain-containing histidine kinase [Bacilli bacterium]
MIKKLRNKVFITVFTSLTLSLGIVLMVINIINFSNSREESYKRLDRAIGFENINNDKIHNFETIYYIDVNGNNLTYLTNDSNVEEENINKIVNKIINSDNVNGHIDKYVYKINKKNNEIKIVLMDNTIADNYIKNIFIVSLCIFILGVISGYYISLKIVKWIVEPVDEAFKKQKQFISDASHELKTPLTIINANCELLEEDIKNNKWLDNISKESVRMNGLVNSLLSLTKVEESEVVFNEFNLSKAIASSVLAFESVAFEKKINLKENILEDIKYIGNEDQIKQLIYILVDNAIKHADDNSDVLINMSKHKNKINIEVVNSGKTIPKEEQEKIFERFYRIDKSRNRNSNSYGIGLSIAKSIVNKHSGKIHVESEDNITKFIVEL